MESKNGRSAFKRDVQLRGDEKSAEEVFAAQIRAMQLVAMWPSSNGNRTKELTAKTIFAVNSFVLAICTVGLLLKAVFTNDLVDRSEAMDIFTLTGSALYKMVFFYIHHEEMVDMANWGAALAHQVPSRWMYYSTTFTYVHDALGVISINFWALCPAFKFIFGETELKDMSLPMNVYDPFDSKGVVFSILYAVCHYGLVSSAQIYMAADVFLFTAIHLANGGFEAINQNLINMKQAVINKGETMDDTMNDYLKDCVKLHTHILIYIRKIDALFRSMFVADVLHAVISLSFAMLQATESKGIFENIKMVVFVGYCFIHQYLNSYFGQHLIDQQDTLSKELLLSVPWNEGSREMRKTYHIMTTGCLKSVRLSAWSVYKLQFATFLEFVKTMISYFMVLRQVQDETGEAQVEM